MGNVEQSTHLSFLNKNLVKNDVEIPKKKNSNLIRFHLGESAISYYKDTEKGFVYDKLNFYCASFEKHDLKHLGSQILSFFKTEKNENGYSTV